jgi:predicted TIM-barrel fold metal-dependent hydrolase
MISRRSFLMSMAAANAPAAPEEIVIDIHQHTNYTGRSDEELITHQRAMGATRTVLLPAGSKYGLAAGAGGNDTVVALARRLPREYVFFANELPDIPETRSVIEKYLKAGAIGIGEQKFAVEADSTYVREVAAIAAEYRVPVLLHFEYRNYNLNFENFYKTLDRYPKVNFIGHAQTWWGNIDRNHDQAVAYPAGPVTPGGITDRLLSSYPNMYGDLSARSGLNSMLRDEDRAREFLKRHQDKLLFGSDCNDRNANGPDCLGAKILAAVRRLAPDALARRKILSENAQKIMKV